MMMTGLISIMFGLGAAPFGPLLVAIAPAAALATLYLP